MKEQVKLGQEFSHHLFATLHYILNIPHGFCFILIIVKSMKEVCKRTYHYWIFKRKLHTKYTCTDIKCVSQCIRKGFIYSKSSFFIFLLTNLHWLCYLAVISDRLVIHVISPCYAPPPLFLENKYPKKIAEQNTNISIQSGFCATWKMFLFYKKECFHISFTFSLLQPF
jgi:hypothetical protein